MSTLMSMSVGDRCIGRCDARCYDAKHENCDCVCGGLNHGAGEQQAIINTRDCWTEWAKDYAKRKGLTRHNTEVSPKVLQFGLFDTLSFSQAVLAAK